MPNLVCYFDGVCEPTNPGGHAGAGGVILKGEDRVFELSGYIGHGPAMSNNVAEYSAIIAVLKELQKYPTESAIIYGDSKLVINHLRGEWRVNGGLYFRYYQRAKELYDSMRDRVTLCWIGRDENSICDDLSKSALRRRGVTFRIQPEGK